MKRSILSRYLCLGFGFWVCGSAVRAESWIVARGIDARDIYTAMDVEKISNDVQLGQHEYMGYSCIMTQHKKIQGPLSCSFKPHSDISDMDAGANGYFCTLNREDPEDTTTQQFPAHYEVTGEAAKAIYATLKAQESTSEESPFLRSKKVGNMTCSPDVCRFIPTHDQ